MPGCSQAQPPSMVPDTRPWPGPGWPGPGRLHRPWFSPRLALPLRFLSVFLVPVAPLPGSGGLPLQLASPLSCLPVSRAISHYLVRSTLAGAQEAGLQRFSLFSILFLLQRQKQKQAVNRSAISLGSLTPISRSHFFSQAPVFHGQAVLWSHCRPGLRAQACHFLLACLPRSQHRHQQAQGCLLGQAEAAGSLLSSARSAQPVARGRQAVWLSEPGRLAGALAFLISGVSTALPLAGQAVAPIIVTGGFFGQRASCIYLLFHHSLRRSLSTSYAAAGAQGSAKYDLWPQTADPLWRVRRLLG